MQHAEPERFDLAAAVQAAVAAYSDVYPGRRFDVSTGSSPAMLQGSPELVVQMLDKLVNNAVDFSSEGDTITVRLERQANSLQLSVHNPGPLLPERMRSQLFDSMVSVRPGDAGKHLGLGLYIARLIAEGHGGSVAADNAADGVIVSVSLPGADAGADAPRHGVRQTHRD